MVRRTLHNYAWCERQRGGGRVGGWGGVKTEALHWQIFQRGCLRGEKAGVSPSLSFHPYRPVAAVPSQQLLFLGAFSRISINPSMAGSLDVLPLLTSHPNKKPEIKREMEKQGRGRIELWYVPLPGDTAALLMLPYLLPPAHYHSVSLSLPPEARTLAPAAWQPLVSLTQLLCCLSHSQHSPPPPLSHTRMDAAA